MSKATSIQKKLYKAYGKVAKTLGVYDYEIYRSDVLDGPITDANVIDTKPIAFSKEEKFKKSDTAGVSSWLCWVDGNLEGLFDIQKGDYLYSHQSEDTYYIASASDHLYLNAVKANNLITVSRVGYGEVNGQFAGDTPTTIASNVPCAILQPSSGGNGSYIPASTYSRDALPQYEIHVSDIFSEIQIRDIITDESGNESQVIGVYQDDLGTKLVTQAMEP